MDYLITKMLALPDLSLQYVQKLGLWRLVDHVVQNYVFKDRKYLAELVYREVLAQINHMLQDL